MDPFLGFDPLTSFTTITTQEVTDRRSGSFKSSLLTTLSTTRKRGSERRPVHSVPRPGSTLSRRDLNSRKRGSHAGEIFRRPAKQLPLPICIRTFTTPPSASLPEGAESNYWQWRLGVGQINTKAKNMVTRVSRRKDLETSAAKGAVASPKRESIIGGNSPGLTTNKRHIRVETGSSAIYQSCKAPKHAAAAVWRDV
uniref:Uncharacterized protein n=1 Tax=Steinernema glaseri TaxID=37863 RepID=A0A1I7YHX9_9BILA